MSAASQWSKESGADDEPPLEVKVSQKTREIQASYQIDEQRLSIVIRLPATFPLDQAVAEGNFRVAVEEKRWQSWLKTTQAIIALSVIPKTRGCCTSCSP